MTADLSAGACAGMADESYATDDVFYPKGEKGPGSKGPDYTEAAKVCARCPLVTECLQEALKDTVQWGYRGGMTPEQRQQLKSGGVVEPQRGKPTAADLDRRTALYYEGLPDPQIAARLGVTDKTITAWRRRNNLAPNSPPHRAHTPAQNVIKMRAYEAGATDFEIARQAGCKVNAIRKWRMRLGLKVNPVKDRISA